MIKSPLRDRSTRYTVPDASLYSIPRVVCPDCGEHASAAFRYPGLDVSELGDEIVRRLRFCDPLKPYGKSKRGPADITPDEIHDLSKHLAPILGPGRPFGPLTEFGPASGPAEGLFDDICWPGIPGPLFFRQSAFDAIREAGFPVTGVAPDARYRRERRDPLIEPEAMPTAHVHPSVRLDPCATCGFVTGTPDGKRLDPENWDDAIPMQRVHESPRVIVINAALAEFIRERAMTGVNIVEMSFE